MNINKNKIWYGISCIASTIPLLIIGFIVYNISATADMISDESAGFFILVLGVCFWLAIGICNLFMAVMYLGSSVKEYSKKSKMSLICLLLMVSGTYAAYAVRNHCLSGVSVIIKDTNIPAVLYEGINPKISGKVNVIVDEDVFSSSSENILLPVDTNFICGYEALREGETKLLLECNEIILPDGSMVRAEHGKQIATAEVKINKLGLIEFGAKIILRPVKSIVFPKDIEDRNVKQVEGDNND